jgi:hypothetical protein
MTARRRRQARREAAVVGGDTGAMGFNPQRQYRKRGAQDIVFVAAALVVAAVLVAWAFLG